MTELDLNEMVEVSGGGTCICYNWYTQQGCRNWDTCLSICRSRGGMRGYYGYP